MKHFQLLFFVFGIFLVTHTQLSAQKKAERTSDKESATTSGDRVDRRSQKARKGNKESAKSSGDVKANNNAKVAQGTTSGGDVRVKNASLKTQGTTSSGDVKVSNNKDVNKNSKQAANNTGDIRVDNSDERRTAKAVANYSGDIRVDNSEARQKSKSISKYSGDLDYSVYESRSEGPRNSGSMVLAREIDRKTQKKIANNEGDIGNNFLERRANMRHKKSKEIANSSGDILVRTLNQRAKKIRKKNKEMANYKGDIIVTKRKKGMHPSAVYRGGKVKNSYTAKERYRKRMMKRMRRKQGIEDANYMKQKQRQPKHNKNEAEIWY
mgnify:CR=1 FL=1